MQSMADALLSGLEGGLSMHGGSATGAVHKGNGGSGGGGGGKAKLPAGMSALVDLKRFEDKTWFNQLIGEWLWCGWCLQMIGGLYGCVLDVYILIVHMLIVHMHAV